MIDSTLSKLSKNEPKVRDMKIGQVGNISTGSVMIDRGYHFWIEPGAPVRPLNELSSFLVQVRRGVNGFELIVDRSGRPFLTTERISLSPRQELLPVRHVFLGARSNEEYPPSRG
jgi:hypothetical protein